MVSFEIYKYEHLYVLPRESWNAPPFFVAWYHLYMLNAELKNVSFI